MIFYLDDSIEMRWKRDRVSLEIADGSERRRVYLRSADQLRSLASACIQAATKLANHEPEIRTDNFRKNLRKQQSEEASEAFQ
jgi:hypothetical protein